MRPTEDPEKVEAALRKVMSGSVESTNMRENWSMLKTETDDLKSLDKMRIILQRDRIRSAARSQLHKGIRDNDSRIEFYLNKQAAYAGHVSFSLPEGESPLGPIKIVVSTDNGDIHRVIDWLAGKPSRERTDVRREKRGDSVTLKKAIRQIEKAD